MQLVPLERDHLENIKLQDRDLYLRDIFLGPLRDFLLEKHSFSIIDGDQVLCCGGVLSNGGRNSVWTLLAKNIKSKMPAVHSLAEKFIEDCPYRPLEADINPTVRNNKRWAEMLGFVKSDRHKLLPNGINADVYVRIS